VIYRVKRPYTAVAEGLSANVRVLEPTRRCRGTYTEGGPRRRRVRRLSPRRWWGLGRRLPAANAASIPVERTYRVDVRGDQGRPLDDESVFATDSVPRPGDRTPLSSRRCRGCATPAPLAFASSARSHERSRYLRRDSNEMTSRVPCVPPDPVGYWYRFAKGAAPYRERHTGAHGHVRVSILRGIERFHVVIANGISFRRRLPPRARRRRSRRTRPWRAL
jgi:hypothetical protein